MRDSVAGVRFRNAGKIFYFHAAGMRLETGEYVVVETTRGPEIAKVVIAPDQVVVNELGREELKPILRLATDEDIRRADSLRQKAQELLPEARRLTEDVRFPAHLDGAEYTLDGRRITFSFTSDERLDYREFVRRASEKFGAKVDMRQMGDRDRAKLAGGYGICGRELCCSSWLTTFPSISIRMAKEQDLPLNPQKISGLCGRLLCCLSYEEEGYKEMRKTLPKLGQRCSTPTGEGRVIGINILRRQVTLVVEGQRIEVGDRDLGLVVRWDTGSKIGDPPPSISRADAIAQGMIEATEEDLQDAARLAGGWVEEERVAEPGPGRGRLPGGGPRKQGRPQPPTNRDAGTPDTRERPQRASSQRPPQAPAGRTGNQPEGQGQGSRRGGAPRQGRPLGRDGGGTPPPAGRPFQRAVQPPADAPGPPGSDHQDPPPASGNAQTSRNSRGRGRRGGRGRGPGSSEGTPPE